MGKYRNITEYALNTLTTHTNLHAVVSEGQSKVRWICMKWKALVQFHDTGEGKQLWTAKQADSLD